MGTPKIKLLNFSIQDDYQILLPLLTQGLIIFYLEVPYTGDCRDVYDGLRLRNNFAA
ncbi:hypothetical protein [Nostoc sp.]|uniref:hypothetical protein n=1 Tax=Nostoc sp. TaxID=1180 RepID=UPI002FF61275